VPLPCGHTGLVTTSFSASVVFMWVVTVVTDLVCNGCVCTWIHIQILMLVRWYTCIRTYIHETEYVYNTYIHTYILLRCVIPVVLVQ
jgi:hypothetical protein